MTENYTIRFAESRDHSSAISMLKQNYMLDETIIRSYLLKRGSPPSQSELRKMEKSLEASVAENQALVAVYEDKVVGYVALIEVHDPLKDEVQGASESSTLERAINAIAPRSKTFAGFPRAKKVLKMRAMGVDREHRGKGLATLLFRESVRWAEEQKFDLVYGLVSSPASKRSCEKVGFKVIYEYDLLDYRDPEHGQIFSPDTEHMVYMLVYEF